MKRKINLLLVEDNEDHVYLTRKALMEENAEVFNFSVVNDGEEALKYVYREGEYADAPLPDLILLDVKLPKKDGFEVLQALKSDPKYRTIPIIMLTSSDAEADVLRGYGLGSNAYIAKPIAMDEFAAKLRGIPTFWNKIATLPIKTD